MHHSSYFHKQYRKEERRTLHLPHRSPVKINSEENSPDQSLKFLYKWVQTPAPQQPISLHEIERGGKNPVFSANHQGRRNET